LRRLNLGLGVFGHLGFSISRTLVQVSTASTFVFFRFHLSRVHRRESVLQHRVAFRISHTYSVVFMIMRFPLRVVAIGGVEAGSGKDGKHVSVFFAWSVFSSSSGVFCCHFRLA